MAQVNSSRVHAPCVNCVHAHVCSDCESTFSCHDGHMLSSILANSSDLAALLPSAMCKLCFTCSQHVVGMDDTVASTIVAYSAGEKQVPAISFFVAQVSSAAHCLSL